MSAPRPPRIGVTTYYKQASWGDWSRLAAIVPGVYVEAVVAAGGTPVLLPPRGLHPSVVEVLDGLLLIGGSDVDPSFYGAEPHPATRPEPYRDEAEFPLVAWALEAGLPTLAVCRGAQVLNAALGGTLNQHLPELVGHTDYAPAPGQFGRAEFTTAPGSLVHALLGDRAWSPCYHHQGIETVAPGLCVTARSADGVVEALETTDDSWVLGVQFHPEENPEDPRLFDGLVAAAGTRAQTLTQPAETTGAR